MLVSLMPFQGSQGGVLLLTLVADISVLVSDMVVQLALGLESRIAAVTQSPAMVPRCVRLQFGEGGPGSSALFATVGTVVCVPFVLQERWLGLEWAATGRAFVRRHYVAVSGAVSVPCILGREAFAASPARVSVRVCHE